MQCIHCGAALPDTAKFCRKCGKVQTAAVQPAIDRAPELPMKAASEPAAAVPAQAVAAPPPPSPPAASPPVPTPAVPTAAPHSLPIPAAPATPPLAPAERPPAVVSRTNHVRLGAAAAVLLGATALAAYLVSHSVPAPAPASAVVTAPAPARAVATPPVPPGAPAQAVDVVADQPVAAPEAAGAQPVAADNPRQRLNELLKAAHAGTWPAVDTLLQSAPPPPARAANADKARPLNEKALQDLRRDDYASAIALLAAAVELDPVNAEIRNNLGYAQLRANMLADAEKNVAAALELGPQRAAAWGNMAEILAEKDNAQASASALQLAIYLASNRTRTLEALSRADQSFQSVKFRAVVADVMRQSASIPAKP